MCAVSYLNTVPLVWGMLHGEQKGMFDLFFRVPSACADMLAAGEADIGIVPAFELLRHPFETLPGLGIACRGAVQSILLVSKTPPERIRTLAADSSSRTSVQLARVWLARRHGNHPEIVSHAPDLKAMLAASDAALLIGDPALRIDRAAVSYPTFDLGAEWLAMTGLPMVFAVWAARPGVLNPAIVEAFHASYRHGRASMDEIVRTESVARGFAPPLVLEYLTRSIRHSIDEEETKGIRLFLDLAGEKSAKHRY